MENLFKAIAAFQADCPKVNLDGKVKYSGREFKYATLRNIIESIKPALKEKELGFIQLGKDGCLSTLLFHTSGESIESTISLPEISNPQDLGKWLTYIKRYQLCSILGIVGEEDTDGQLKPQPKAKKQNIKTIPPEVLTKVTLKLESSNTVDLLSEAKKECKSEIAKYPMIKSMFMAKYNQLESA